MSPRFENDAADRERLAREIAHHSRIADRAEGVWNWDSPAGRQRADRRARLFIERGGLRPGVRALEVGCGTGVFLEKVAASGATIAALDLSDDLLARARTRVSGASNVALLRGNAEQMPFPDSSFDSIYGSSILHHLRLGRSLAECFRLLKPAGVVVFAEPNILNPQVTIMFRIKALKDRYGVSPDEMAFSRFGARAALRDAGFADAWVVPFDFVHPALPQSWVGGVVRLGRALEATPLLREIAGSLLITARRPA